MTQDKVIYHIGDIEGKLNITEKELKWGKEIEN